MFLCESESTCYETSKKGSMSSESDLTIQVNFGHLMLPEESKNGMKKRLILKYFNILTSEYICILRCIGFFRPIFLK